MSTGRTERIDINVSPEIKAKMDEIIKDKEITMSDLLVDIAMAITEEE